MGIDVRCWECLLCKSNVKKKPFPAFSRVAKIMPVVPRAGQYAYIALVALTKCHLLLQDFEFHKISLSTMCF